MTNDQSMAKCESGTQPFQGASLRASPFGLGSGFVIRSSSFVWQIGEYCCHNKNVNQSNFEEKQPAEPHQLIPTKARQRPAHPHHEKDDGGDFREENGDVNQTKN